MTVEVAFAQGLAGLLAPALPYLIGPAEVLGQKTGEAIGEKIGEDAWNRAKQIWDRLKPWADKKPEVASTIKKVADGDPLAKDALARDLKKLLESMPEQTVNEIRNIVFEKVNETSIIVANRGGVAIGGNAIGNIISTGDRETKQ